ncbi:MAG: family 16 glycosylhydrolase [Paracoccaceae bacterium]
MDKFKSSKNWYVAEYDFDHASFDTDWRKGAARFQNGLHLHLEPHKGGSNQFSSGSIRRHETTGYGRYSVTMQAAKGDGMVNGFFTYTGPYYGTVHDEIDIEILGKDPTKLQAGWFADGDHKNKLIDLGFDASTCVHTYSFEWLPGGIRWYVGNQLIFSHDADDGHIPHTAGHLFVNLWAADRKISNWAGHADPRATADMYVDTVTFTPLADLPVPSS